MDMHKAIDIITEVVAVCSLVHTILPPWEAFDDFPKLQKYYKLLIYIIGYMGLNARSTVNHTISVNNPDGPNANAPTLTTAASSDKGGV